MFEDWGDAAVSLPTVTTQAASDVSYTTATGNGNITDTGGEDATNRGIVYSDSIATPTTADSPYFDQAGSFGTGAFTRSLTGLDAGTHYYARAYATNSAGTSYGDAVEFTTLSQAPTVTTSAATSVSMTKDGATGGTFSGNLTSLGDDTEADVSFEYGLTTGYGSETSPPETKDATGNFTASMPDDLAPGATYHYRSKAVNAHGTAYGSDQEFTLTMPSFTTSAATYTSPGAASATLNGNISAMNTANNTYGWFEWGYDTSYGNTTANQTLSATGNFSEGISGFLRNVTVHYRAKLTNGSVTANGSDATFLVAPNELAEVLWYEPIAIIVGTTLPDRDGGDQPGLITWGSNYAGITTNTTGGTVPTPTPPSNWSKIVSGNMNEDYWKLIDVVPDAPTHLYTELGPAFLFGSWFVWLSNTSGLPLAMILFPYAILISLGLGLLAYVLTMGKAGKDTGGRRPWRGSIPIMAIVSGLSMTYFVIAGGGVIPGWVLIPYGVWAFASLVFRQNQEGRGW